MGLLPGDPRILVKVNNEILDWIIAGDEVQRQWFVRFARFQGYVRQLATALAGVGIGPEFFKRFAGGSSGERSAAESLQQSLPGSLFYIGVGALVVWAILTAVESSEGVTARALFASDFATAMRTEGDKLRRALAKPLPMADLMDIQQRIDQRVFEARTKKILQWAKAPPANDPERARRKSELIDDFRRDYMRVWQPEQDEEGGS